MAAITYPSSIAPRRRASAPAPHLRLIQGGRSLRPSEAVYVRRRLVALAAVAVLAIAMVVAAHTLASGLLVRSAPAAPAVPPAADATVHVVQPGETLWSIARTLTPEGDVRGTVDRLAARNGGATLQVGQRLVLG